MSPVNEPDAAADQDADDPFAALLHSLDDARRAQLVAAYVAVEAAAEPIPEARMPVLGEPAGRRRLNRLLAHVGRTLVKTPTGWTSGYTDEVTAALATEPDCRLSTSERAVLTLILVYSVAIPRSQNKLTDDTWLSPYPTPIEELQRRSMLAVKELEDAVRRLRLAGLVSQVKTNADIVGGYVPGPQFHRLTANARRRLQEELVLAAGPNSALASAIRSRRHEESTVTNARTERT